MTVMTEEVWPALPYEAWKDTYATLHMWTQVVGKVALAQAPPLNHSWGIAMQVTPRGLSTRTLPHGDRTFSIQFDFIDHKLEICTTNEVRHLTLEPRSVADFYQQLIATLAEMGIEIRIWTMPQEVQNPIPFEKDQEHAALSGDDPRVFPEADRGADGDLGRGSGGQGGLRLCLGRDGRFREEGDGEVEPAPRAEDPAPEGDARVRCEQPTSRDRQLRSLSWTILVWSLSSAAYHLPRRSRRWFVLPML